MRKGIAVAGVVLKEMVRRKDFYVLFVLTAVLTLLMGSITLFNDDTIARYLKEICLLLIWISGLVIAITTAARQIPAERDSRTLFPLLAKPISRTEVLAGKFLGCWLATGLALLVFYVFFAGISASREHSFPVLNGLEALWLQWLMLAIVIALTLLGSLLLSPAANATILFLAVPGILLLGEHLNDFAVRSGGIAGWILYALYYAMPHLEFFDVRDRLIHDWEPIGWVPMGVATLYALVYAAFFLAAAALLFRRKHLN